MIVDCHCHAGTGDGLTGPWDTAAPIEPYLRRARAAGIDRTVVFAPFQSDYARGNAEIARIVARHPGRLIGFAFVHSRRDAGRIREMVAQAVQEWGFRGIKVHLHDVPATREVCRVAREFRVPIMYDVGGQVYRAELLAAEYPDVNFIIPHLGSFGDDWRAHIAVIDLIARYPNVFTDTSGVRRFDYLVQAVKRGGAHKVLFGSDGPWLHPAVELVKIRMLRLPRQEQALILGGNALRLMRQARVGRTAREARLTRETLVAGKSFEPQAGASMPERHRESALQWA